jgi:hypothetical protein
MSASAPDPAELIDAVMVAPPQSHRPAAAQALQGAQVPNLDRPLGRRQHRRGLLDGQTLQVTEDQHLAVTFAEPGQGVLDAAAQLLADQVAAGTRARAKQALSQLQGRRAGQRRCLLAQDAALAGVQVALVQPDQVLPGQPPQPGVERHRPLAQVAGQLLGGLGQRLLDDVGRIDAGGQPAVHAHPYHLREPVAMTAQELLPRWAVALAGLCDQLLGIRVVDHASCSPGTNL